LRIYFTAILILTGLSGCGGQNIGSVNAPVSDTEKLARIQRIVSAGVDARIRMLRTELNVLESVDAADKLFCYRLGLVSGAAASLGYEVENFTAELLSEKVSKQSAIADKAAALQFAGLRQLKWKCDPSDLERLAKSLEELLKTMADQ
jgi:hypothetical protein